jgi:tRNA threonylcarbamoyladenosine biosynthesis protein TsaE
LIHAPILKTAQVVWANEAATQAAAERLAACPGLANAFIELHGDLGAGKTTFVRHLLRALGVQGRIKSPTFAVMEPHEGQLNGQPLAIAHFDFYRFADPREFEEAGFRDVLAAPGLKVAEWVEKIRNSEQNGTVPSVNIGDIAIELLATSERQRTVNMTAFTATGIELLQLLEPSA